jgi:hypothetical protein
MQGKEGFDAHRIFEEKGRDLVHAFNLPEAFLDRLLPLMGLEHLAGLRLRSLQMSGYYYARRIMPRRDKRVCFVH